MKPRLLLLDGHSLAYRAFFALPAENFTTSTGQHTNAVYGFASMLMNLIRDERPTHIAVAFDVSRKTFRSEKFPEYKATRSATPDEFKSQSAFLYQLVDAFGIKRFELAGFEADDILATISTAAKTEGFEVLICTGDRDSFQLVDDDVTVLYPKKGVTELARMTPAAVSEKYGLTPTQYPDFAALRGDPSDNLPSVPGVGEKTATKWIQEYGSLSELLAKADKLAGKVGESLRASIESVRTNRELTQLLHDVPIDFKVANLLWEGPHESDISKLFDHLEIRTLKERLKAIGVSAKDAPVKSATATKISVLQISSSDLEKLIAEESLPITIAASYVGNQILEYSVHLSSGKTLHIQSNEMGKWFLDPKIKKITHGAKPLVRDFGMQGLIFDTELAGYLVNPGTRSLDLSDLTQRYLGFATDSQGGATAETLFDESNFEPRSATWIAELAAVLEKDMKNRELLNLFNEMEIPVLNLLAQMEALGIAVDVKKLKELETLLRNDVERETAAAHKAAGKEFNVASPKQLQAVLFEDLGLPKTKKIKTGYTTDADSLDWLFTKTAHPVLQSLLRIREAGKLKTTIEGLLTATGKDERIHTTFQQTVAATGRLSSTDPNLQNIPVRTEEGRKIRDCFIAQSPFVDLMTADYSQIEMRIMAHLSKDAKLLEAFHSGEDLHSTVASEVFGVPRDEVDAEMRRKIKAMSYGLAYGLSSFGLAQQLDLSPTDASELMARYFERFGGIQTYLKSVVVEARAKGYTETIMGRRRYLPDLNQDNRQRREIAERMALNSPIQGSAADIIKIAMLNVGKAIAESGVKSRLLLQVHDELICEIAPGESEVMEKLVRKEMGNAYPLNAPLEVNVGFGKTWDLAAH